MKTVDKMSKKCVKNEENSLQICGKTMQNSSTKCGKYHDQCGKPVDNPISSVDKVNKNSGKTREKSPKSCGEKVDKSPIVVENSDTSSGKIVQNIHKTMKNPHPSCRKYLTCSSVSDVQESHPSCGKCVKSEGLSSQKCVKTPNNSPQKCESPLISVIIPVYNVEQSLARCFDSVLAQTYQNLEILVIDDGSTDNSGEICDLYAQQHPQFKVVHQSNQGLSGARNTGIDLALGKYLTFVDSDDAIKPQMIMDLYHQSQACGCEISICGFSEIFTDKNGQIVKERPFKAFQDGSNQVFDVVSGLQAMLLEYGFTVSAWGKLFLRELFVSDSSKDLPIRFPVGALYEDVGTTYKLVLRSHKISFLSLPEYQYYQNHTSITKQAFTKSKLSLITLTDQMCDDLDSLYPQLIFITKERRMRARFSILRQILPISHLDAPTQQIEQEIIHYLKAHRQDILDNPYATKRDRIALRILLVSKGLFRLSWKFYSWLRK